MPGKIHDFLTGDHTRLEGLLNRALAKPGTVDYEPYRQFRGGLLRHIAMEEKVLLPALRKIQDAHAQSMAQKLRLDHGALAALLVPSPDRRILATIHKILETHNVVEEDPGGFYDVCEALAGADIEDILRRLESTPEVSLAPHVDSPRAREAMRRALSRAGHALVESA